MSATTRFVAGKRPSLRVRAGAVVSAMAGFECLLAFTLQGVTALSSGSRDTAKYDICDDKMPS
jgi:hypothetical protein